MDIGSVIEAYTVHDDARTGQDGANTAPRQFQDEPRWLSDCLRGSLGTIEAQRILPRHFQDAQGRPGTDSSWHRFLDRFLDASWNDFGKVLGGQDAAMTARDGAKTAQDDTKMAPRRRQDGVVSFQDAPKTRPNASKAVVNSNMSKI